MSSHGNLTFKDAYKFYSPATDLDWTSKLWKAFIPPRVSCTAWKLLHGQFPTQDQLQKKGTAVASRCEICKIDGESMIHVFISCSFAALLWKWLWSTFNINISTPSTPMNVWKFVTSYKASPQIKNLLISGCLICFHILWEVRNKAIFDDEKPIPSRTMHHFKCWLKDVAKMVSGHKNNNMQDFTTIKNLGIGVYKHSPTITEVLWCPPHPQWVKVNTDGLALESPGHAAIGVFSETVEASLWVPFASI